MRADVLLENFSPGTMDRHGVGSVTLCELNPRLIYAAGTGFGRTGPDRDYLAMDITVQAMSGIMAITGDGEGPPLKAGAALCDFLGGIHLYGGIVTALFQRERTGAGCVVDVAIGACGLQPVGGASACGRGFSLWEGLQPRSLFEKPTTRIGAEAPPTPCRGFPGLIRH